MFKYGHMVLDKISTQQRKAGCTHVAEIHSQSMNSSHEGPFTRPEQGSQVIVKWGLASWGDMDLTIK